MVLVKIFILFSIGFVVFGNHKISKKIINGKKAPEDQYKWSLALRGRLIEKNMITNCGATIINRKWLITAAHCFYAIYDGLKYSLRNPSAWDATKTTRQKKNIFDTDWNDDENTITMESDQEERDLNSAGIQERPNFKERKRRNSEFSLNFRIQKIFLHPKYDNNVDETEYDIALLKLSIPLENSYFNDSLEILQLPSSKDDKQWPKSGQMCIIIGWGCMIKNGPVSKEPQIGFLQIQTNTMCIYKYQQNIDLNEDREFCAGTFNSGHGICHGDSGSGLACKKGSKWVLAGIASATHKTNPENYPGLFTRVSYYLPWIEKIINNK